MVKARQTMSNVEHRVRMQEQHSIDVKDFDTVQKRHSEQAQKRRAEAKNCQRDWNQNMVAKDIQKNSNNLMSSFYRQIVYDRLKEGEEKPASPEQTDYVKTFAQEAKEFTQTLYN